MKLSKLYYSDVKKTRILCISNFHSDKVGRRAIMEDLADLLITDKYKVLITSKETRKLLKLIDIFFTVINFRNRYDLAIIDLFSGLAFYWAAFATLFIRKILKKPVLLVLRGGNLYNFSKLNSRKVKKVLEVANIVCSPSKYLQQSLRDYRNDILFLPNGISLANYRSHCREIAQPNLVWLRAFHRSIYNPLLAVQTLSLLLKTKEIYEMTMIGPDKGDGSLQEVIRYVEENHITNSIKIIRGINKSDVPTTLNNFDIFLNTTNIESFGVSVLEAAACGLCIVSTNVGELPYLWEDGVDALLVPPNDPEAMAAAVKRILTEPGLAQKLSTNARKKAEQYDWSVILPQWEKLFEEVTSLG